MKGKTFWIAAAICLLATTVVAGDRNVTFVGGEGEVFDLADLLDGETRLFGDGEKQMSATRDGDVVRITREANGETTPLTIECSVDQDSCQVMTIGDDGKVAVMIEKTRQCDTSAGDCELHDIDVVAVGDHGAHQNVFVKKICDGDDCDDSKMIEIVAGGGHGRSFSWVGADGGAEMVFVGGPDSHALHLDSNRVRLGCPEGDASLWVDREEAGDTFLCPKHSVPLEKQAGPAGHHRVLVETASE
jgi:hypothetical protein